MVSLMLHQGFAPSVPNLCLPRGLQGLLRKTGEQWVLAASFACNVPSVFTVLLSTYRFYADCQKDLSVSVYLWLPDMPLRLHNVTSILQKRCTWYVSLLSSLTYHSNMRHVLNVFPGA
jgi:hypothetical protein